MYSTLQIPIDPTNIATPDNALERALLHSLENGLDELAEASAIKIKSGDFTTEDVREALDIMELVAFRAKVRALAAEAAE